MMDKFVKDFLKIGNFTPQQKDKMLELYTKSSRQILEQKIENLENVFLQKIENLENKIPKENKQEIIVENKQEDNISDEKPELYKNPFGDKSLSKFLLAYNQDKLLKYTWHTIDKETITENGEEFSVKDYIINRSNSDKYSVKEHQKLLEEQFKNLSKDYSIDKQVYTLLLVYLTGKNFNGEKRNWSSNNVNVSWGSEELLKWSEENPDYIPNANGELKKEQKGKIFKLSRAFNSKLNGKRIRDFSELVIHCKNLFHLRNDNSLKSILSYVIDNQDDWKNQKIEFNLENINENIVLFTDVDKLVQFFKEYINLVCENFPNQENQIILSFTEDGEYVNFVIHHINQDKPFYAKTSESTILRRGNTYTSLKNKIDGMCEFWLEADFQNEPSYRINLWTGEWNDKEGKYVPTKMQKTEIEKVGGVKHILKFKR